MWAVTNIGKAPSVSSEETSASKTTGKDEFMKMLLAQLQNQNPLNPLDGTDFAAQLAQFSSDEQLINMNSELESLTQLQTSQNNVMAANLIGKQVSATQEAENRIAVTGSSADLNYSLAQDAQKVTVKIYNEEGNLVKTLEGNNQSAGSNTLTWNCATNAKGNYTFEVSAVDAAGNEVSVNTEVTGVVTDVQFKDQSILVTVGGQQIPFANVTEVSGAPAT